MSLDLAGERFAVWGAARSGIAASNLLVELGASVVLSDSRPLESIGREGLDARVELRGGGNVVEGARWVVPSPGIPPSAPIFAQARALGVRLMSEIELAARVCRAPIVAITGTDGKSTTTEMVGALGRAAGLATEVAGNIGTPLSERVRAVGPDGLVVAEVSAFQLWSCGHFRPRVAIVTNVAPDHTDYFGGDHAAYIASKARVLADLQAGDVAVLRGDDPVVAGFETAPGVHRVTFGPATDFDFGWDGTHLLEGERRILPQSELGVVGRHNVLNALAALAAGRALGLSWAPMLEALRAFRGLPHRMEAVRVRGGVTWLDDSKATNPHAAVVGLRSLSGSYVAIVGGFDKGLDQSDFEAELAARARAVLAVGPDGSTAARTVRALEGRVAVYACASMDEAVARADALAQPSDSVVLSPAASSFDLYRDYHHRGQVYQAAVRALPER
jgi:UDP-N-acetylmuramoylalanine--D-glutamate ligase